MKLTIVTPTYNRGYIIDKAYKSLQEQTCHEFEWFVIDDGSTDNTEEFFQTWRVEEKRFKITYIKKPHIGLNRVLNIAINTVQSDYWFKLDSDDYLMPNAVERILMWVKNIDDDDVFVGIGIARCFPNGEYIKGVPPVVNDKGYVDATNLERSKYNVDADMSEAYKVTIMKQFPYPVWSTENYAPEQLCLDEIALAGYKVRWYAEKLYVCEYLPDGITMDSMSLIKNNPMGFAMMYNHMLKYGYPFIKKYKCACQHIALSIVGKNPKYILKSNALLITLLAMPLGLIIAIRRYYQYKKI